MGRGRGKGKRLTAVPSHEDIGSDGEEILPTYRRRGRPQRPMKDDLDEDVARKLEQEERDEMRSDSLTESGKKRERRLQMEGKSDSSNEENGNGSQTKIEDSARSNGFRQSGNRRKSIPRRAAEAGVECIFD